MGQILVKLDDLESEIRRIVRDKYGGRKGSLSLLVEEALRKALSPPAEISASTLLEVIDYVARASKEGIPKDEMLTNVFIMLDREFEQSVVRGIEDLKHGRYKEAPEGADMVAYLRRLLQSKR